MTSLALEPERIRFQATLCRFKLPLHEFKNMSAPPFQPTAGWSVATYRLSALQPATQAIGAARQSPLGPQIPQNAGLLAVNKTQEAVEKISRNHKSMPTLNSQINATGGTGVAEAIKHDHLFIDLVNQSFSLRTEAVNATKIHAGKVFNHSLKQGAQSGGRCLTLVCSNAAHSGCPLKYRWTKSRSGATWQLDLNSTCLTTVLSCKCTYKLKKKDLMKDPAFLALSDMKAGSKKVGPKAVRNSLHAVGIAASTFSVQQALNESLQMGKEQYEDVYKLLEPRLCEAERLNKGTRAFIDTNADGTFKWACLVIGQIADVIADVGLEVIGLDGQHSSNHQHKLKWMTLEGAVPFGEAKDYDTRRGRNMVLPIAKIVCASESSSAYTKMIELVKEHSGMREFLSRPDLVVFSDRGKAVEKTIRDNFPQAISLNCARHILGNAVACSGEKIDECLFWSIRDAETEVELRASLLILQNKCPRTAKYLAEETDWSKWQQCYVMMANPVCRTYGMRTSNLVECENARATNTGAISSNPLEVFQQLLVSADNSFRIIKSRVSTWVENNQLLTPPAQKSFVRQKAMSNYYLPVPTGGDSKLKYRCNSIKDNVAGCRNFYSIDLAHPFLNHGICRETNQMKTICRHYIACQQRHFSTSGGDPGAIGLKTDADLCQHTHHRGYMVPIVNNMLAGLSDIAVPPIDNLLKTSIHPAVPYELAAKKKRKPNSRVQSRGEEHLSSKYKPQRWR